LLSESSVLELSSKLMIDVDPVGLTLPVSHFLKPGIDLWDRARAVEGGDRGWVLIDLERAVAGATSPAPTLPTASAPSRRRPQ
jgi:hypothetical protein